MKRFPPFLLLHAAVLVANAAGAADLVVDVEGVQSTQGQVFVGLYANSDTFLRTPLHGAKAAAEPGGVRVTFVDVTPGEYALSAFHDENDNGHLDFNLLGMPVEPLGYSRDATGMMGPPKFDAAKFSVGDETQVQLIHLR